MGPGPAATAETGQPHVYGVETKGYKAAVI
jgi:hypothetical protein